MGERMKNKIIIKTAITVLVLIMINVMPVSASYGGQYYTSGDYEYELHDGYIIITKYLGTEDKVIIPDILAGNKVQIIGEKAFADNKHITSVQIPDKVAVIQEKAFFNCQSLKSVYLPDSLKEVWKYAFAYCESLKTITFPKDIEFVGDFVFMGDVSLEDVFVNHGGTSQYYDIDGVFILGKTIKFYPPSKNQISYVIPPKVRKISQFSFCNTKKLCEIIIPDYVYYIGDCFGMSDNPLNIILKHRRFSNVEITDKAFDSLLQGSKIICKNETAALELENYTKADIDISIIRAKALTFVDGSVSKNITLTTGEKYFPEYIQKPLNTTDSVSWDSSDYTIAQPDIDTGEIEASDICCGKAVITGTDENGNIVTLNVTVREPLKDISKYTASPIKDQVYSSADIEPPVTVKDGNNILEQGIDYSLKYSNNNKAGIADIEISGEGLYCGTLSTTFLINKKLPSLSGKRSYKKDMSDDIFKLDISSESAGYLSYISSDENVAYVSTGGYVHIQNTGTTYITVTSQDTDNYLENSVKINLTVTANISSVRIISVKNKSKKIILKWKKIKGVSGYEIYKSTKKNIGYKKISEIKKSKILKYTDKSKLKSGKKYYYKLRTYTKKGDKKYYGKFSKVKSVTIL